MPGEFVRTQRSDDEVSLGDARNPSSVLADPEIEEPLDYVQCPGLLPPLR